MVSWTMASSRAVRAPARRPQRVWNSHVAGKRSESALTETARSITSCRLRRSRRTSAGQVRRGRKPFQGIEPEPRDRRLPRGVLLQADAAEPPRVREGDAPPVVRGQLQLPESRAVGLAAIEREAARHPEVERGPGAAVQLQPEVLAAPPHGPHATAAQPRGERPRADAREDDGIVVDRDRGQATSAQPALEPPARGLDLGQLGQVSPPWRPGSAAGRAASCRAASGA